VENVIDGVGLPLLRTREPRPAFGIAIEAPNVVRVHGNRIAGVSGARDVSAGIFVVPPVGSIEITNNIVHVAGAGDGALTRHCFALRIEEIDTIPRTFVSFALADFAFFAGQRAHVLVWTDLAFPWISVAPARSACNVRTNELRADGILQSGQSIVRISDRSLHCTFGGNICDGTPIMFGVIIEASTIVADSNQVLIGDRVSLIVDTKRNPNDETPRWTCAGNVTRHSMNLIPNDGAFNWHLINRNL
jgi:hypothetical protein